ncbi:MAG: sulfurtransferase TusA family protein [Candidatus Eisenbacteria bacterium]|nr:sulfurtransferase TusA family protein [Candidatus Eisenbacteria bacterium]
MMAGWEEMPSDWRPDSRFDGRDTGCGEILIDLRIHFRPLPPGARVAILARDPGAPVEMRAWCRVTGHELLDARHPFYLVRVRPGHGGATPGRPPSKEENRP